MRKLGRFLVSESVLSSIPNINAISLDRFLSDHRPILLKDNRYDYGPTPFRFFHHWLEMDGFKKFVENIWKSSTVVGPNALLILMNKLRCLKKQIWIWNRDNMGCRRKEYYQLKKDLGKLDSVIDYGRGNDEMVKKRLETIHQVQKLDRLEALEMSQNAKIKWAIDGDERGFINAS